MGSCRTCSRGRYLPYTLNRYLHLEGGCTECPVGRFIENDSKGPNGNWWLHDSLEDCELCPRGKFANETGMGACATCETGRFSSEPGAIGCDGKTQYFLKPYVFTRSRRARVLRRRCATPGASALRARYFRDGRRLSLRAVRERNVQRRLERELLRAVPGAHDDLRQRQHDLLRRLHELVLLEQSRVRQEKAERGAAVYGLLRSLRGRLRQ